MCCRVLLRFFLALLIASVDCNPEGDSLTFWKSHLIDPNNVLHSWDPTLINPCTWFHVTCNSGNSVTRLDLGHANLSGPLVPHLGNLTNLQYLEVYGNHLSGSIPKELGKLKKLISLGLYKNSLTGTIPASLGNLPSLRFLRIFSNSLTGNIPQNLGKLESVQFLELNSNKLTGTIPVDIIKLVRFGNLNLLNVSNNLLAGTVRHTNTTEFAVTTIIQDAHAWKW